MPQGGFTVGRDITLNIVTGSGPLSVGLITGFQSKQDTTEKKIKGLDGVTRHNRFPDGWSGRFTLERQDSTLDDYFNQLEANFYAGLNEQPVTITETITDSSGQVKQYRFIDVLLKYDDAGDYRADNTVTQTVSFIASRRV